MHNIFRRLIVLITAGILPAVPVFSQDTLSSSAKLNRLNWATFGVYSASLVGLNSLWYNDYDRTSFHTFNDNDQWLQVDKVGHVYSTYNLTNLSHSLYTSIVPDDKKKAIAYSSISSFFFLTTVEVFDGFSDNWGFSWGDFIANTGGIALYSGQELLFNKQIVRLKYSFSSSDYRKFRPNTLGNSYTESLLKDYNGQTYWASINLNTIKKGIGPKWLSISIGYGGEEMVFAKGTGEINGRQFNPYREYYLSLDVDWEQVSTNKQWLRWCLKIANCIKVPAPTISWSKSKALNYYGLYF